MTDMLRLLSGLATEGLLVAAIVFLRVGGAMAALPGFGERMIPPRIRLALAVAFTLVVAPAAAAAVLPHTAARVPAVSVAGLLIGESLVGLGFGLVARLSLLAIQTAGTIIAQATSLAQMFGFSGGEPSPTVSQLLTMGGIAIAVAGGLPVRLAEALIWTYGAFPPGSVPLAALSLDWVLPIVARSFALAFSLAAPFLVAALLYNLALGIMNRAMPQLMVSFIGTPALILLAFAFMLVALPSAIALWWHSMAAFLADPAGFAR